VLTNAGAYGLSDSPYGTYDQGGNVWEWTEQIVILDTSYRGLRGGCWNISAGFLAASYPNFGDPADGFADFGFRVASSVPEPDAGLLGMMGVLSVLGLATSRRRRAN
jgi:MYXO-CTERM domain-containing protein